MGGKIVAMGVVRQLVRVMHVLVTKGLVMSETMFYFMQESVIPPYIRYKIIHKFSH